MEPPANTTDARAQRPRRIALLTPHAWAHPHPVNEHVSELARGLRALHLADPTLPDVVVLAPSLRSGDRRRARRTLRMLADSEYEGDPLASGDLLDRSGVPVLALGVPLGRASVALRAALRLVFESGVVDLLHVHDPLDTDLSRHATRSFPGLTIATFHRTPPEGLLAQLATPMRERVIDAIDQVTVTATPLRQPVAALAGIEPDEVTVVAEASAPHARRRAPAPHVVLARGEDDEPAVRRTLKAIRTIIEQEAGDPSADAVPDVTLLARFGKQRRPATPRWLRGRLRTVTATTRDESDATLADAAAVVSYRNTTRRAQVEAMAMGVPIVDGDLPTLDVAAAMTPLLAAAHSDTHDASASPEIPSLPSEDEMARSILAIADQLWERRRSDYPIEGSASPLAPPVLERRRRRTAEHDGEEFPEFVDLHMHTNHSKDCSIEPAALLDAARKAGLTAIAVTDHNEIDGAFACAALAEEYGVKVIVGEEVMTEEGEVIGLFLKEWINPGQSWKATLDCIHEQDGLVYVPHPFDRMHKIPDIRTLRATIDELDIFEVFNSRLAFEQYNRDALRFARKYDLVAGSGSDSHVVQGLGSAGIRMPSFDDPESFLVALRHGRIVRRTRSYLYVQGLKRIDAILGRSGGAVVPREE